MGVVKCVVIVCLVGGILEIIYYEEIGLMVLSGDINGMSVVIERLLNDEEFIIKLGEWFF